MQLDALLEPIVAGVETTQKKPTRTPWWYEVAAREQLRAGDEWELCSLEFIGDRGDTLACGSVTTTSKSGARTWAKPLQKAIVTLADVTRVTAAYEASTGLCGGCGGDGLEQGRVTFVPKPVTYVYRTCSRCTGSGKPTTEARHERR